MVLHVEAGEGKYRVMIEACTTAGKGICVFLHGGEKSHVGGVALAIPRKKSSGEGLTCDLSQICSANHKDVYLAAEIARSLSIAGKQAVSVTAGIHVDGANLQDVQTLSSNAHEAAALLLAQLNE